MTKMYLKTGLSTSEYVKSFSEPEHQLYKKNYSYYDVSRNREYESFVIGGEGDAYLHFAGLIAFDRKEDANKGHKVSIFGDEIIVADNINGCPSDRRDGVSLYFYSENGPDIKLNIIQHKGQTLAEFELWDGNKPKIAK